MIPDFLFGAADDPMSPASVREDDFGGSYVEDPLEKLCADALLAGSLHLGRNEAGRVVHNFHVEAQERNNAFVSHYRKIAENVTKKKPAPLAGSGWDEEIGAPLAKRKLNAAETKYFSDTRAWFARQMATLGKNANDVVDVWCEENPHRSAAVEADLRAIAATL